MNVPDLITKSWQTQAVRIPTQAGDALAWNSGAARGLLSDLEGTRVAVGQGDVYRSTLDDLVPIDGWVCERGRTESVTEYARRSRDMARSAILLHQSEPASRILFVLRFDAQDAAA